MPSVTPKTAIPTVLRARMTVERDLFDRQYQGMRVGEMPTLHILTAHRHLRDVAVQSVAQFIRDMKPRGYEPIDEPGAFLIFGPYQTRAFDKARNGMVTEGWSQGEDPREASADFVVQGMFLATQAKVIETA